MRKSDITRLRKSKSDITRFQGMTVEVYEDIRGQWRWHIVARNGRILGDSAKSYVREKACRDMAERIFGPENVG